MLKIIRNLLSQWRGITQNKSTADSVSTPVQISVRAESASTQNTSTVFISHAGADNDEAIQIQRDLENAGVSTWLDRNDIKLGADYSKSIQDAHSAANCLLLLLSPASIKTSYVTAEWEGALQVGKQVFVAMIAPVAITDIPLRLRTIQRVDFTQNYDLGIQQLSIALRAAVYPNISMSRIEPLFDFDTRAYRAWLIEEVGYIDIRGIGVSQGRSAIRFPILDLYTDLAVQTGLSNLDLDEGHVRGSDHIPLTEILKATRCLAIMGDPGCGKTTFLRYVSRKQVLDPDKPLPLFIRLADVLDFAASSQLDLRPEVFIDYLLALSDREHLEINREGLKNRLEFGSCILLLDGLDELPSIQSREEFVRLIETASRSWNACQFILTSRPMALIGKAVPAGFDVVGIEPLHYEQVITFIQTWTSLVLAEEPPEVRRHYWGKLLSTIMNSKELRNLARNAVMLTSMMVVHYNQRRLPKARADLLEALIHWLMAARSSANDPEHATPRFRETVYRDLALSMFELKSGRRNQVGRQWAAKYLAKYFNDNPDEALNFLEREENETGVLVRRGVGDYAFWHLSFQEYLAAKEIASLSDDETTGWWARLKDNLDIPEWKEVFSLVPACLLRLGSDLVDLFFHRLSTYHIKNDLTFLAGRVGLGGIIQRDLTPSGYEPTEVNSWQAILNEVSPIFTQQTVGIPLEVRYDAAIAYGLGGDPRIRDFEETWVQLPPGTSLIGSQSIDSSKANYDAQAVPWEGPIIAVDIPSFEIRRFPITVGEYAEFVNDGGYRQSARKYWSIEGWKWLADSHVFKPRNWEDQLLTPNTPITGVSWFEAVAYCQWLTENDLRKIFYMLPSETMWEYAARRNILPGQRFIWGNKIQRGDLSEVNWAGCALRRRTPIGMFPLSTTIDGVVDMIGNVEEWCSDNWSNDHLSTPRDGKPFTDTTETYRVVRGGSTIRTSRLCRPTYRTRCFQDKRYMTIGFRPIRLK